MRSLRSISTVQPLLGPSPQTRTQIPRRHSPTPAGKPFPMTTSGAPAPPRFKRSSPRKKQQLRSRRLAADFAAGEAEAARASARPPLPASPAVSAQSPIWRALPREFFEVDALDLAPRLLGKLLRRDEVVLRITKVEGYRPNDSACHGRFGITARTAPVVCQALGLSTDWSHHPLYTPGGLEVLDAPEPESILVGPRVGIEYALPEHVAAPWRFTVAGTPWISAPKNTFRPR